MLQQSYGSANRSMDDSSMLNSPTIARIAGRSAGSSSSRGNGAIAAPPRQHTDESAAVVRAEPKLLAQTEGKATTSMMSNPFAKSPAPMPQAQTGSSLAKLSPAPPTPSQPAAPTTTSSISSASMLAAGRAIAAKRLRIGVRCSFCYCVVRFTRLYPFVSGHAPVAVVDKAETLFVLWTLYILLLSLWQLNVPGATLPKAKIYMPATPVASQPAQPSSGSPLGKTERDGMVLNRSSPKTRASTPLRASPIRPGNTTPQSRTSTPLSMLRQTQAPSPRNDAFEAFQARHSPTAGASAFRTALTHAGSRRLSTPIRV